MKRYLLINNSTVTEIVDAEGYATLDSKNATTVVEDPSKQFKVGDAYTLEQWELYNVPMETLIANAKNGLISQITTAFDTGIAELSGGAPVNEMLSWSKQEAAALAYNADPSLPAPLLDSLILARGLNETKEELVAKILAKNAAYTVGYGELLGKFHKEIAKVETLTTLEEVKNHKPVL